MTDPMTPKRAKGANLQVCYPGNRKTQGFLIDLVKQGQSITLINYSNSVHHNEKNQPGVSNA